MDVASWGQMQLGLPARGTCVAVWLQKHSSNREGLFMERNLTNENEELHLVTRTLHRAVTISAAAWPGRLTLSWLPHTLKYGQKTLPH